MKERHEAPCKPGDLQLTYQEDRLARESMFLQTLLHYKYS